MDHSHTDQTIADLQQTLREADEVLSRPLPGTEPATEKTPRTRPQVAFHDAKRAKFLDLLRAGHRRGKALDQIQVSRSVLSRYVLKHPEFREAMEQAEADACEHVEDALWRKACDGHYGSAVFYLLNRSGGRWQDMRNLTVSHQGQAPFTSLEQQAVMSSPDQLQKALSEQIPDTPATGQEDR